MKQMKKPEEGKTLLLIDKKDLVTEITCNSIFPNLEICQLGLNNDAYQIISANNVSRYILATKDKKTTTEVLLLHEKKGVDVIPFLFTNTDSSKLSEQTLIEIIHFEFFRFKFATLRSKTNLLMNFNLSNVSQTFKKANIGLESIKLNPLLFYSLIIAIENKNTESFVSFICNVNNLCSNDGQKIVDDLLLFLKESNKLNVMCSSFSNSINEFFIKNNLKDTNSSLLSFIIGQAKLLGKDFFKLKRAWLDTMIFATSFDTQGSQKDNFFKIKALNHQKNKFIDDISVFTFATIFNNKNYIYKDFELNKENKSKIEEIYTKSSLLFTNISNSKINKSTNDKYELIKGFLDYIQYLSSDLKDDLKTPILKKYLNLNE